MIPKWMTEEKPASDDYPHVACDEGSPDGSVGAFIIDNPNTHERYLFGDIEKVVERTMLDGFEEIKIADLSNATQRQIPAEFANGRAFRLKEVK